MLLYNLFVVDSSAGILMTSRTCLSGEMKLPGIDSDSRRRHKSAGDNCNCYVRSPNKPIAEAIPEVKAPFLRSCSFGNDAQIIRKIRAAKDAADPLAKWIDSPLKGNLQVFFFKLMISVVLNP